MTPEIYLDLLTNFYSYLMSFIIEDELIYLYPALK